MPTTSGAANCTCYASFRAALVEIVYHFQLVVSCCSVHHAASALHNFILQQILELVSDPDFHDYQFRHAANEAAKHGNLEVLRWLATEHFPECVTSKSTRRAAKKNGQSEAVKWLDSEYPL